MDVGAETFSRRCVGSFTSFTTLVDPVPVINDLSNVLDSLQGVRQLVTHQLFFDSISKAFIVIMDIGLFTVVAILNLVSILFKFEIIIDDGLCFRHLHGFNSLNGNPTRILKSEFYLHVLRKCIPIGLEVGFTFSDAILKMLLDELRAPGQGIRNLGVVELEFVRC